MSTVPWSVFPPAFVSQVLERFGQMQGTQVLEGLCQPRTTTFRTNQLKTTAQQLEQSLTSQGFTIEPVRGIPSAFLLLSPSIRELETTEQYQRGELYVQGLSSLLPATILDPQPGESVLDLCAAPGSKTTQMAAMLQNQGLILANDTSRVRLYKLQANLDRQGVTLVKTRHGLGQTIHQDFPAVFDKVLVDVPCTMEGRLNPAKPKTWKNWGPHQIKELAHRQQQLLRSAIRVTRPGGTLVYSTCTLNQQENEGVIEWVLKKMKGQVEVLPIKITIDTPHQSNDLGLRILPSQHFEGFFVSHLSKLDS